MNHHDPGTPADVTLDTLLTRTLGAGQLSSASKRNHLDRLGLSAGTPQGTLPATTPAITPQAATSNGTASPSSPIPFLRRYAELAAILVVLLLVGGGIYVYQLTLSDDDGSPAISGFTADDSPSAITDPVEFVLAYQQSMDVRDMDTVRAMLTERFREFDGDWLYEMPITGEASGIEPNPDDWIVEHNEHFTIVRFIGMPNRVYVLRPAEDDTWLVDRDDYSYWLLLRRTNDDTDMFGGPVEGVEVESLSDHLNPRAASMLIMSQLLLVEPNLDGTVDVTINWAFTRSQTAEFPLDGIHWVSGDETGDVDITWTNSRIVEGIMSFPEVPDDGVDGIPSYLTTFTLQGAPGSGSLELHIPDMTVITLDGDEVTLATIIRFPIAEYPPRRSSEAVNHDAPVTHFPQFAPGALSEGGDADLTGRIVLVNGCIRLQSDTGDEHPLLIWPDGFALLQSDGVFEVVNAEGDIVARGGERINLWGGFWPTDRPESLDALLTSPLPENCPGPYWNINPQIHPLDDASVDPSPTPTMANKNMPDSTDNPDWQIVSGDSSITVEFHYTRTALPADDPGSGEDVTIVILNGQTGQERARFHPPEYVSAPWALVSHDGTRLVVPSRLVSDGDEGLRWFVYDTSDGELISTIQRDSRAGWDEIFLSADGSILYRVWTTPSSMTREPDVLRIYSYDTSSGGETARLVLDHIPAGAWHRDPDAGPPMSDLLIPGAAMSPDGRQIAIVHADVQAITLVDVSSLTVERIFAIEGPDDAPAPWFVREEPRQPGVAGRDTNTIHVEYTSDGRALTIHGDVLIASVGVGNQPIEHTISPMTVELE